MDHTKDEINYYCFIKYVEIAVIRKRRRFIEKLRMTEVMEVPIESKEPLFQNERDMDSLEKPEKELLEALAWDSNAIRTFFLSQMDPGFSRNIKSLSEIELQIIYASIFLNLSFNEIGAILGIPKERVSMINSYARKKMRKGWKKNGVYRIVKSGEER